MVQTLLKSLAYLPADIISNILCRLPIRTIISCKCVCKPLFELIGSRDFSKFYLSKSCPGLIIYQVDECSNLFRTFQFDEGLCNVVPVTEFEREAFIRPPHAYIRMEGSANGLLLLRNTCRKLNSLYICNPITREFINFPDPQGIFYGPLDLVSYGFGVSKKTHRYKVVQIFQECVRPDEKTGSCLSIFKPVCHVYTLGTGSWRSVPLGSSHEFNPSLKSVFLNGNLHWLVSEINGSILILCLDLQTELFKVLTPPPNLLQSKMFVGDVGVLGNHLCLCDTTSSDEIVIWVMKENWTREVIISKLHGRASEWCEFIYPIKVFGDGDMLFLWGCSNLVYYSKEDETTSNVNNFGLDKCVSIEARLHASSFLSLKSFIMENVAKF